jgi:hypothetical protein
MFPTPFTEPVAQPRFAGRIEFSPKNPVFLRVFGLLGRLPKQKSYRPPPPFSVTLRY